MNPNTFTLTSEFKPKVNLDTLRKQETQKMFEFLPILRNQTQFKNKNNVGYMPNREINAVIDQAKLNSIINNRDGTRVYPSGAYKFNLFPPGR